MAKKVINIDPVIDRRVNEILQKKKRRLNSVLAAWAGAMGLVSAISSVFVAFVSDVPTNPTFEQQIQRLNETEQSLKTLMQFVQKQQTKLRESREVITDLKMQHEKLKPVVEADQKVVDAILDAQAARSNLRVWRERGIGFVIGTLSSLVAAGLIWIGTKAWNRFRDVPASSIPENLEDVAGDAEV